MTSTVSQSADTQPDPALVGLLYPDGRLPDASDNEGPKMLQVLWSLISLSTVVVGARLWSKYKATRRLYGDDYLMAVALFLGLLHAALMSVSIQHGEGRHFIYLSAQERYDSILFGMVGVR